jgi:hypothetical protein
MARWSTFDSCFVNLLNIWQRDDVLGLFVIAVQEDRCSRRAASSTVPGSTQSSIAPTSAASSIAPGLFGPFSCLRLSVCWWVPIDGTFRERSFVFSTRLIVGWHQLARSQGIEPLQESDHALTRDFKRLRKYHFTDVH